MRFPPGALRYGARRDQELSQRRFSDCLFGQFGDVLYALLLAYPFILVTALFGLFVWTMSWFIPLEYYTYALNHGLGAH